MLGMVVCSFALREDSQEPNPCNIRLAEAVERILEKATEEIHIVSQWEVAKKLKSDGVNPTLVVEPFLDGSYLDTKDVWAEAKVMFALLDITEVIIVANPFIHGFYVERMIKKDGFKVFHKYDTEIGPIGFDPESLQWWTRGPSRCLFYVGLSALGLAKYFR
ncbi:MAG: hypothetical protein WC437_03205 [Patescibacteria group bacterium]